MYFAFLLHKFDWNTKRLKAAVIYVLLNLLLVVVTIVYVQQKCRNYYCTFKSDMERVHNVVTLCNFSLLVIMFGYISYQMYTKETPEFTTDGSDIVKLAHVAWIIFLSRLVYNIMITISDDFSIYSKFSPKVSIILFKWWGILLLALWEIVPSLAVLIYFREIPPSSDGFLHHRCLSIYYRMGASPASRPEHTVGFSGLSCPDRVLYVISRLFCCPPNFQADHEGETNNFYGTSYEGLYEPLPSQNSHLLPDEHVDGYGDVLDPASGLGIESGTAGAGAESIYYGSVGSYGPLGSRYYSAGPRSQTASTYQPAYDETYALYSQDPTQFKQVNFGATPRSPGPGLNLLGIEEEAPTPHYISPIPLDDRSQPVDVDVLDPAAPNQQQTQPDLVYGSLEYPTQDVGSINSRN